MKKEQKLLLQHSLRDLLNALPTNRDWLNPVTEKSLATILVELAKESLASGPYIEVTEFRGKTGGFSDKLYTQYRITLVNPSDPELNIPITHPSSYLHAWDGEGMRSEVRRWADLLGWEVKFFKEEQVMTTNVVPMSPIAFKTVEKKND